MSFLYWDANKRLWLAEWQKLNPDTIDVIINEVEECWHEHQMSSPEIKEHLEGILHILRSTKKLLHEK